MTAFVVLTRDDKRGTLEPPIVGPFASTDLARAFADLIPFEPFDGQGGYQGAVVVSEETADYTADEWIAERDELGRAALIEDGAP